MKRIIWICGLIGGLISVGWFILSEQVLTLNLSIEARTYFGYATMILGFSLIFVAVKNYRDNNNGLITFGKALRIGLLITLIASTIYVVTWMIDSQWFYTDYFSKFKLQMLAEMKTNGATAAQLKAKATEFDGEAAMYKNPVFNALFTYMEIVPVGLVVSLIAALILKRKHVQNDTGAQLS